MEAFVTGDDMERFSIDEAIAPDNVLVSPMAPDSLPEIVRFDDSDSEVEVQEPLPEDVSLPAINLDPKPGRRWPSALKSLKILSIALSLITRWVFLEVIIKRCQF